ncbi:MAG: DUF7019 family protein [bacterium]
MRYYSYISDAKVDMLLPQVPDGIKQTVAAELGFDLKLVKGKMKAETKTLEDRVARLAVVEKHLRKEEQLGSVSNPRKWIEGQHLMYSLDIGADAILFACETETWVLGLAGSANHLAGTAAPENVGAGLSFMPRLAERLVTISTNEPQKLLTMPEETSPDYLVLGINQKAKAWAEAMINSLGRPKLPPQHLGFLAKCLAVQQYGGRTTVLASPLYVEILD